MVGAGEIGVPAFVSTLVHLHRLRADVLPLRRRPVPVRAAGRGGGVRDARLLRPVADAGADAGDAADARLRTAAAVPAVRRAAEPAAARLPRLRPPLRARARAPTRCLLSALLDAARRLRPGLPRLLPAVVRPLSGARPRLLPDASMPARSACTCARATGTRIEETARLADDVEAAIRELVPKDQLETVLDNLGVPNSGINLSYSNAGTIGTLDGEILLSLKKGHRPTEEFVTVLCAPSCRSASRDRVLLPAGRHRHPDPQLRPAGGDRRPVHRQQHGGQRRARRRAGEEDPADPGRGRRACAPALRCAGGQPGDGPHPAAADGPVGAERRPERAGLALGQLADGAGVLAQSAERHRLLRSRCRRRSTGSIRSIRCSTCRSSQRRRQRTAATPEPQLLGNLVEATSGRQPAVVSRFNIQPAVDVYASVQGTDLASVAAKVQALVDEVRPKLPRGSQVTLRGQVETMQASFLGLGVGLAMAIVLVYLLVVVNFQSWIDAFIIVAALAGGARAASPGCSSSPARRCRCRRSPARS